MHRHPVEGSLIKKEHTMLNALLTRWTRSRPSTSSSFGRAAAGDSLWQSLLRLIPGDAEPQQSLQRAQLARVVAQQAISPNVREILEKTLKAGGAAQ